MDTQNFTNREAQIDEILAHGYTPQEIGGDFLGIAWETVRKIISNIKPKKGYQLNTELVADYWCRRFGTTLEEQRNLLHDKLDKAHEKIEKAKEPIRKGANVIIALVVSSGLFLGAMSDDRRNVRRPSSTRYSQTTRIVRTRRI